MISDRANGISLSPTLKIAAEAQAMRAEGINVVDLSVGEPDFPTPDHIKEAAKKAIEQNFTRYTASDGIPDLKKAIVRKLKEDNGLDYEPSQIVVSSGGKQSLFVASVALFNEGDEVLIPTPYWVSYPEQVKLAKARPVYLETEEETGFKITPEQLAKAINFKTKALILNSPSNPSGAAYARAELEAIAEVCMNEGLYIISDDIYEKIVYDDFKFTSIASIDREIKKRVIIVNGVSKAYSMTGWRIGYAAGPQDVISAMARVQSHDSSNPCSVSQMAALTALTGTQEPVSRMLSEFQRRRNYVLQRLNSMPGVTCNQPEGAFYVFPNFSEYFDKMYEETPVRNSFGLAYCFIKFARVAVVPGEAFGSNDYIRISYAASMEELVDGLNRMEAVLKGMHDAPKVPLFP